MYKLKLFLPSKTAISLTKKKKKNWKRKDNQFFIKKTNYLK